MLRTDIIQKLIDKFNYQSYLEIGIAEPEYNFMRINCKYKECVDPYEPNIGNDCGYDPLIKKYIEDNILKYKMTSDEFFEMCPAEKKYDIVFIDGLHYEEQVGKDIINSLKHLNPGGTIVVHDCLPETEEAQDENRHTLVWNGSVWKAIPQLLKQGISYFTIDTDMGCGVIQYSGDVNSLYYPEKADYDFNMVFGSKTIRDSVMHVISTEEFLSANGLTFDETK